MTISSLLKDAFHNSVAEGIYNEIVTRSANYYYFLGKTLSWEDELAPETPVDNVKYENDVRSEIITVKQIKPTDVAFVIPRYNWTTGSVYDQYDDQYDTKLKGVNLKSGGDNYISVPNVYIGSTGKVTWSASTPYTAGQLLKAGNNYYIVTIPGTSGTTAPTHTLGVTATNGTTSLECVAVNDANGSGAAAVATIINGQVIDIALTTPGVGYTDVPTVIVSGASGSGASAVATIARGSATLTQKLEDAKFYVVTDDFNVYKCLDNNNGALSTVKPTGTPVEAIKTTDGYVWKFLYNVPVALRNKFLSNSYLPVTNALQNQYYSNGGIETVRIDAPGSGYISASISVQGDGYLESNPIYVTGHNLTNSGAGYVSPTLVIDPPFTGVGSWVAATGVIIGQKLSYQNNIYQVMVAGTTGSAAPTHRYNTVANGSTMLKYIGTTATGTLTLGSGATAGKIIDVTLNGNVREINITNNGSGYLYTPTVTITNGGGSGAAAIATLRNGVLFDVYVTDPGVDYTSDPSIVIGTSWVDSDPIFVGDQIFYENRLYTATKTGTLGTSEPTHSGLVSVTAGSFIVGYTYTITTLGTTNWNTAAGTTGITYAVGDTFVAAAIGSGDGTATTLEVANGTSVLAYAGVTASATAAIKYGAGYSRTPVATVTDTAGGAATVTITTTKSEARLQPVLDGGQLVNVNIIDGGIGYTYASLTVDGAGVEVGGGPTTTALVSADLSYGDINSLQANIELLTVDGQLNNIAVVSGGYGFGGATVTIEGDGTGATANAVITNGAVTKINMTNFGSGYRWARVTVTGDGHGAKARAIISPHGGHGKNSLNGLHARTLMFYSNVSLDTNQGFDVNNDYRQIGIIKSPKKYGSQNYLTTTLASACWAVSGSINTTNFPPDSTIYDANGYRFRIVTNTGTSALIQAIDNIAPTVSSVMTNDATDTFNISQVTPPTIDKYSGDMLFIDNKLAFTPSSEQTVTLRTVIKF